MTYARAAIDFPTHTEKDSSLNPWHGAIRLDLHGRSSGERFSGRASYRIRVEHKAEWRRRNYWTKKTTKISLFSVNTNVMYARVSWGFETDIFYSFPPSQYFPFNIVSTVYSPRGYKYSEWKKKYNWAGDHRGSLVQHETHRVRAWWPNDRYRRLVRLSGLLFVSPSNTRPMRVCT